ncbi:MAG: hypothetical protein A3A86_01475 [Elusimicrobia bacterium RIFCSPLOWO2_01_FULL_60_11]|nr:MAG: hypothetical protein A3A86_01475 [Elusimicrobia bacterium RIFCSPLOWO2_01_FULL_60_11]
MRTGFWSHIKTPAFVMGPMANVTDAAFRRLIAKYSKPAGPAAMFTEFVSVEGLLSAGRKRLLSDFWYTEAERPIVAQVFGGKPEQFREVAELVNELGFDGIDINMGCPDRAVERSGAGAALMKDPTRAAQIIRETKAGAGALPVSVKARIGYNKNELDTWLPALLAEGPASVTLHLRTRKEMSDVPAHWELAEQTLAIRDRADSSATKPLILGNGDVYTIAEAEEKVRQYGVDGVMFGRGIFGQPWLFSGKSEPDLKKRLRIMVEHTELFEELFKDIKSFNVMKKHCKAYAHGFRGANELRAKLMDTESAAEMRTIVEKFILGL